MTREEFKKMTQDSVVLYDGATGSNLMAAGMTRGACPEVWVQEHPEVMQEVTAKVRYSHGGAPASWAANCPGAGGVMCVFRRKYNLSFRLEKRKVILSTLL